MTWRNGWPPARASLIAGKQVMGSPEANSA